MELFQVIQQSTRQFFLGLPLILISLMLFLGIGLGNKGMLWVFFGQSVLVPAVVFVAQFVSSFLPPLLAPKVRASDLTQFVPSQDIPTGEVNVTPSYWITQVVFFLTYVFMNAQAVHDLPVVDETVGQKWRVENRIARSLMSMIMVVLFGILLVGARWWLTGAETFVGTAVGVGLGIALGTAWYSFAGIAGARSADIFGVVQQMVPIDNTVATTCKGA